jgi:hypothetical protein
MAPFTVKASAILIIKTALGLLWALNVKLMPVAVEMFGDVNVYTLFPKNVVLVVKPPRDWVDGSSAAALNALSKSEYAVATVGLLGAG